MIIIFTVARSTSPPAPDVTTTAASALPGLIPTLVVLLVFHRTLTRGTTAGAVK